MPEEVKPVSLIHLSEEICRGDAGFATSLPLRYIFSFNESGCTTLPDRFEQRVGKAGSCATLKINQVIGGCSTADKPGFTIAHTCSWGAKG